jgi:hypothetical protein
LEKFNGKCLLALRALNAGADEGIKDFFSREQK